GKNLYKMGKRLFKKNRYSHAVKLLREARNHKESDSEDIDIYLLELEIYESLNQYRKYMSATKKLFEYYQDSKFNPEQTKNFLYKLKSKAANLQRQISKNRKSRTKRLDKANLAKSLFIILAKIEPEKSASHIFFAGETLYAVDKHEKAFKFYRQSMKLADKYGDNKTKKKALDGVMASLSNKRAGKKIKNKYIIEAYRDYIQLHPRSKQTFKIYQRLFTLYLTKKKISKAEETLLEFKDQYPKSRRKQEAMLAQIIDYHKKANNKSEINSWVERVKSGEFKVSKKVAKRLSLLLLNIQFEKVEEANKRGNKNDALEGYMDIYNSDSNTKAARRNSAYNAAILLHKMGDVERMHEWSLKTLDIMNGNHVKKFNTAFLTIAIDLFNRRNFSYSADIYDKLFVKTCRQKLKNKTVFFKNAVVVYLTSGKYRELESLLRVARTCNIPSSLLTSVRRDILDSIIARKDFEELEKWIIKFISYKKLNPYLIYPLFVLYEKEMDDGNIERAQKMKRQMMRLYRSAKNSRKDIPLEGLDAVAEFDIEKAKKQFKLLKQIKLSFPEKKYNQLLEKKFVALNKLTNEALSVLKIGSGKGIVRGYYLLTKGYNHVIQEVLNFVPPGKSKEYVASFRNSMKSLILPVKKKMKQYQRSARLQIRKYDILSIENSWFITGNLGFHARYFLEKEGILMDRKGKVYR
ncbi:MAG: hypothetical protein OXB84_05700, partial [Halobacteriovoraceae bacterium]|nr:hypothetical protein [Halobacteriovoraceae bacterium]